MQGVITRVGLQIPDTEIFDEVGRRLGSESLVAHDRCEVGKRSWRGLLQFTHGMGSPI
jgi:hypothetical protein